MIISIQHYLYQFIIDSLFHSYCDGIRMDSLVRFNVGGVEYITTRETVLCKDSYFERMLSGTIKPGILINNAIFIDRNGRLFEYVLDYLRNREFWLPPSNLDLVKSLINEAQFFSLDQMLSILKNSLINNANTFQVRLNFNETDKVHAYSSSLGTPSCVVKYLDTKPSSKYIINDILKRLDGQYDLISSTAVMGTDEEICETLVFRQTEASMLAEQLSS